MSKLRMPYQCLKTCGDLLIAARGSSIDTFNIENRTLASTWKCPTTQEPKTNITVQEEQAVASLPAVIEPVTEQSTPPAKRRKLSFSDEPEKSKQKNGKGKNHRSDALSTGLEAPAVIALTATKEGRHVIAVTGEDKSIRVFENIFQQDSKHALKQISQRAMPKRPCALSIADDDATIISADKFGDVFSLPLLALGTPIQPSSEVNLQTSTPEQAENNLFTPAANNLTVHSVRNRRALENQKRQTKNKAEKAAPLFEHKLLLGHVSMLTDVALLRYNGKPYIFTADRDEHIRISRGAPQAHIIEQFCLGHTEFVSRLCIPATRPAVLISGGGDDDIFLWNWEDGQLISRADLKSHVEVVHHSSGKAAEDGSVEGLKIAVSNIQHVRLGLEDVVLVSCEAIPALFVFILTPTNTLQHIQRLQLPGNVLSFVARPDSVVISIDNVHAPFSTSALRTEEAGETGIDVINPLQAFTFEDQRLVAAAPFEVVDQQEERLEGALGRLGNLLYGLENLRKRDGDGKEEE